MDGLVSRGITVLEDFGGVLALASLGMPPAHIFPLPDTPPTQAQGGFLLAQPSLAVCLFVYLLVPKLLSRLSPIWATVY